MFQRAGLLASLFSLELLAITLWLDNHQLQGRQGLAAAVRDYGPSILRLIVGFAALFAALALMRYRSALEPLADQIRDAPVSIPLLSGHSISLLLFILLSLRLYAAGQGNASSDLVALCWIGAGLSAIALGALAFFRFAFWKRLRAVTGSVWIYALLADVAALLATNLSRSLWPAATRITFSLVAVVLGLIGPVLSDPAHMTIGTQRFSVEISPACSGLEGVGLMLVFGLAWLTIFRREYRFPRALLLLPAGLVFIFFLNSLRIALLILIGSAGAERIATEGFHSQAGWMIFNLAAVGFSLTAGRSHWISVKVTETAPVNLAAVWMMPLVSLLAAGMIAHAAAADFEWLYPLRFIAVVSVVWRYRSSYRAFDWRIGWQAPAMGVLVFAIWIGFDRASIAHMPTALAAAVPVVRFVWLAIRALASSAAVPFAEELAFRGYLLRHLPGPLWSAVLVSSVAFGLLHGDRWFAAILAGAGYALVYLRKGRVSEAIVAHGVTNALIAVDVLCFGQWNLW